MASEKEKGSQLPGFCGETSCNRILARFLLVKSPKKVLTCLKFRFVRSPLIDFVGWHEDPPPVEAAAIGDRWVESQASVLLKVPSAVIRSEFNYLINPLHPRFVELVIGSPEPLRDVPGLGPLTDRAKPFHGAISMTVILLGPPEPLYTLLLLT